MTRHSILTCCVSTLLLLEVGCAAVPTPIEAVQRVSDYIHCVYEEKQLIEEQRRQEIEALREERKLEHEALRAQVADQRESLRAKHDSDVEGSRTEFKDRLQTKLALDLDQKLNVGELQVDEKKLAEMLEQRSEQREALKRTYDSVNDEIKRRNRESLMKKAREALNRGDRDAASQALAACCAPVPNCAQPDTEPLVREPLQRPLTPEEIPFLLPITVSVGVGGSRIEKSSLLRQPVPRESLKKSCCQPGCGQHAGCVPGQCTQGSSPTAFSEIPDLFPVARTPPMAPPASPVPLPEPPVPQAAEAPTSEARK